MRMKRKAVILSAVVAIVLSFFAGCSSIPAKIATAEKGGQKYDVPTSYYLYNAYLMHAYLEYQISQSQGSTDLKTLFSQSASSSLDYAQMYDDNIKNQTTTLYMGIKKFDEQKLKFTADEQKSATSAYDTMVSNYGEAAVTKIRTQMRMSETAFREFLVEIYKNTVLFNRYFATGGEYEIKEDALKELLTNEYYRVKHILIKYPTDDSGNAIKDTANAKYVEAKAKVDGLLAKVKAGEDFVTLGKANSEDTGSSTVENGTFTYSNGYLVESCGYTFTSGSMDENFYNEAKTLKVGEVGVIESTYGWHIMKKYDVNEVADIYTNLKNALFSKKSSELEKTICDTWAKDYKFTFNDNLVNKYSISKLKNVLS